MTARDKRKIIGSLLGLAAFALIMALTVACNQVSIQPTNQSATGAISASAKLPPADATATQIAFIAWAVGDSPQGVEDIRDHDSKKYAQYLEIARAQAPIATRLALTPTQPHPIYTPWPTDTLGPPPPAPTQEMGITWCPEPGTGATYVFPDCWRGTVNGQMTSVGVGLKRVPARGKEEGNDPTPIETHDLWVVMVYKGSDFGFDDRHPTQYDVPEAIGPVVITQAQDNQLILSQSSFYGEPIANSQFIIFDLATRQFLTAQGKPMPFTLGPTDVP